MQGPDDGHIAHVTGRVDHKSCGHGAFDAGAVGFRRGVKVVFQVIEQRLFTAGKVRFTLSRMTVAVKGLS